jgi:hypothetical protein
VAAALAAKTHLQVALVALELLDKVIQAGQTQAPL